MAQINRNGKVGFADASLSVWEDPDGVKSSWERQFKKDVFLRIVQQLNRLGWTCTVPEEKIKNYGINFARSYRYCTKGDLQADLEVSGRCIKLAMFQNVNAPDRPDYGGRYQSNKELCMPYLMRLEMERTRRRIRNYLCNIFDGYEFSSKKNRMKEGQCGFMSLTAMDWLADRYEEDHKFTYHLKDYVLREYDRSSNSKAANDDQLTQGKRVWFFDSKGRMNTGIAYYNNNNMWWVVTGKYNVTNRASFELYTTCPCNPRTKRNSDLRRKRLEQELSKSIKAMNFERSCVLRDIIFPKNEQLFVVFNEDHKLYHKSGFRGYSANIIDAGKFTAEEAKGWNQSPNKVIALND